MSLITFYKYQGTGNDFIVIDNRDSKKVFSTDWIKKVCDRHFGIGSDGLILIENAADSDFEMVFYNPDGSKSFCGNGSRCAMAFAAYLKIITTEGSFTAIDGKHMGKIISPLEVSISVKDVSSFENIGQDYFIHTGSPHYIIYVNDVDSIDIINDAHKIRYNTRFEKEGTNVNFVQILSEGIKVRTYERGVENETLSCGSGVTACALSYAIKNAEIKSCKVISKGGVLNVRFERENNSFSKIQLIGPAQFVFKGEIDV